MLAFSISFFLLLVRYQACCSWNSGAFPQGSALAVGDPCSSPHSCPAHLFFLSHAVFLGVVEHTGREQGAFLLCFLLWGGERTDEPRESK